MQNILVQPKTEDDDYHRVLHEKALREIVALFINNTQLLWTKCKAYIRRIPSTRMRRVLLFLLAVQVITIFLLVITHNPLFYYDESHTLRIAQKSAGDMVNILSYEQNFPAYYLIVHGILSASGGSVMAVMLFQYAVWLVSVALFYQLMKSVGVSSLHRIFFTYLYSAVIVIARYAISPRMYGLMTLLSIIILHRFVRYVNDRRPADALFAAFSVVVLAFLHPVSAILIATSACLGVFVVRGKKTRAGYFAILGIAGLVWVGNLMVKQGLLYDMYMSEGVMYVKETSFLFHDMFDRLFFNIPGSWLSFFVFGYLVIRFFRTARWGQTYHFTLLIWGSVLIVLTVFAGKLFLFYHISYLTPALLLVMYEAIRTLRGAARYAITIFLSVYFGVMSLMLAGAQFESHRRFADYCRMLSVLPSAPIITNYTVISLIDHCFQGQPIVYTEAYNGDGLVRWDDVSSIEILRYQARMGGRVAVIGARGVLEPHRDAFRESISALREEPAGDVLYYMPFKERALSPEELGLFQGYYSYADEPAPLVFMFKRMSSE